MKRARRALTGLEDDIRNHIDCETQDNIDRGMAPEEARRQALLKFGNIALAMEDTRRLWSSILASRPRRGSPAGVSSSSICVKLEIPVSGVLIS